MKGKETQKLYHSISNVKEDYIEEAWKAKTEKSALHGLGKEGWLPVYL